MSETFRKFVQQTVNEFTEGLSGPDAWDHSLKSFADRMGFFHTGIHVFNKSGTPLKSLYSSRMEDGENLDYETQSFNPRYVLANHVSDQSAQTFSDRQILAPEEAARNVWMQDVAKPLESYAWLGGFVPMSGDVRAILCVIRGTSWNDPSHSERLLMHNVLKGLSSFFETYTRIEDFNLRTTLSLLQSYEVACFVSRDGKIITANSGFERLLRNERDVFGLRGYINLQNSDDQSRLNEILQTADPVQNTFVTKKWSDGHHRRIRIVPLPWSLVGPSRIRGMLVVECMQPASDFDVELLRLDYNLSAAESETAMMIALGLTTEIIAERRSVSISTVRSQIRALLEKMDCESRVQITAKVHAFRR